MIRNFLVILSVALFGIPAYASDLEFLHDARAAHDLLQLELNSVVQPDSGNWAVLRIAPGRMSGFLSEKGMRINPKTGEPETLPGVTQSVVIEEGTVKILATPEGKPSPQKELDYYWQATDRDTNGVLHVYDFYDPFFTAGGVVLAGINQGIKEHDRRRYEPVFLLPNGWESWVEPALKFSRENGDLFNTMLPAATQPTRIPASERKTRLEKLLDDENPLLGVASCKSLAENMKVDAETFLGQRIGRAKEIQQGIFVYFLLRRSTPESEGTVERQMSDLIASARLTDDLKYICLGLALSRAHERWNEESLTKKLAGKALARYREINGAAATEDYFRLAFRFSGVEIINGPASAPSIRK